MFKTMFELFCNFHENQLIHFGKFKYIFVFNQSLYLSLFMKLFQYLENFVEVKKIPKNKIK